MNWIYIAIISGNLITAHFDTEEACLGRQAVFAKEFKVTVNSKCINMTPQYLTSTVTLGR